MTDASLADMAPEPRQKRNRLPNMPQADAQYRRFLESRYQKEKIAEYVRHA
jgi:hypothetical protein